MYTPMSGRQTVLTRDENATVFKGLYELKPGSGFRSILHQKRRDREKSRFDSVSWTRVKCTKGSISTIGMNMLRFSKAGPSNL